MWCIHSITCSQIFNGDVTWLQFVMVIIVIYVVIQNMSLKCLCIHETAVHNVISTKVWDAVWEVEGQLFLYDPRALAPENQCEFYSNFVQLECLKYSSVE